MYSTLLTAALFIAPAIQGALADFAISSPALTQCQEAKISWEATNGPYNLIVVPAANPCGDALVEVGDFNKTFIQWKANIPAGTQVVLSLVDADDNEAWSNNITVGASSDTSCLAASLVPGASSSSSAGAAAPSTTLSVGGSASSPAAASGTSSAASSITTNDSDSGVVPIGAANAGILGSGAFTVRQVSAPLMVVSGLVAAFALSL